MCRISGLPSCESLYAHLLHIQSHLLENTSTNKDCFEIMLCRNSKGRSNSQPDQQKQQQAALHRYQKHRSASRIFFPERQRAKKNPGRQKQPVCACACETHNRKLKNRSEQMRKKKREYLKSQSEVWGGPTGV